MKSWIESRTNAPKADNDRGFTLIELLVVIIIIGILAAIAIPVFLNQRQKGYDAQAKSDLRNMATAEETYLTDNPSGYSTASGASSAAAGMQPLTLEGFKSSTNVDGYTATATGAVSYLLTDCSQSGKKWKYDSSTNAGVVQNGTCTF